MIRSIDHINIATPNLASTRDFFINVLGLEDGPRPDFGGFPGHWLYANGRAVVHLQLARGDVVPSVQSALNHAAFEVADIDAMMAKFDRLGVVYRTFEAPGTGVRQLFFEDPNGVALEINSARLA
jgi:catechol 2,3-dioxygenase-like lactoylglutathione lyase family enzyme